MRTPRVVQSAILYAAAFAIVLTLAADAWRLARARRAAPRAPR
jgi:hypothetical protein